MRLGHTASRAGQYGIVIDYDGRYTIEWENGEVQKLATFYCEADIPAEPAIAALRRESRLDTLVFGDEGWDIISVDHRDMQDAEFQPGLERKPDLETINRHPGMIWDPVTHSYVQATGDQPLRSYSDPELAPDENTTYWAQNPESEGAFGHTSCVDCGIEHKLGQCPLAQVHPRTDPFPERTPKPLQITLDPSFPSGETGMLSSNTKGINSMLYSSRNSYQPPETPNLRDCPEGGCSGKMMDVNQESLCHDCGHREPIIYHQAKELLTPGEFEPVDPNAPGPSNWDLAGMALAPFAGAAATFGGGEALGLDAAGEAGLSDGILGDVGAGAGRAADMVGGGLARGADLLGGKKGIVTGLLGSMFGHGGGGGGGQQQGTPPDDSSTDDLARMSHEDDVGISVDNDGQDSFPDSGNKGFTDDVGDSPENLKDTNELGGTANHDDEAKALDTFEILIPKVIEHHKNGTGKDDPLMQLLDQIFEHVWPGYKDEPAQKAASVRLSTPPTCPACMQDLTGAVSCKSPNPQQASVCPIFGGVNATQHQQSPMGSNPLAMQPHASIQDMHEWEKTAARRPKMCPFHTTLIDYALTIGDPAGALHAMGTHMFGDKSCQGGWEGINKNGNPAKCRYKPEMIQQTYWDNKEAEAEQRKQQRELQQQQLQQMQVQQVQQPVQPEVVAPQMVDPNAPEVLIQDINAFGREPEPELEPITQDIPAVDAITTPWDYEPAEQGELAEPDNVFEFPQFQPQQQGIPVAARYTTSSIVDYIERHLKLAADPSAPMPDDSIDLGMGDPNIPHQEHEHDEGHEHPEESGNSIPNDTDGHPLEEGRTYEMRNPGLENFIPDRITIQQVDPHFIQFKVENDVGEDQPFAFQDEMPTSQIKMEGIQFTPSDTDELHPNALGEVAGQGRQEQNNDDNTHAEDGMGVDDIDSGGNSKGASSRSWLMREAGRDYSVNEQREFIHEEGSARNLDKLDLTGTHYPQSDSDDDYGDFLWA